MQPPTTSTPKKGNAAEHQHYVPKIILRKFLSNDAKEQVQVYDLEQERSFTTSIRGIMAERRFNECVVGENWRISFEKTSWLIEEQVKPTYEKVIAERLIPHTPEDLANLSTLLAFQFLRTKTMRNRFKEFDDMITNKAERMGFEKEQIAGWSPLTEDRLKEQHFDSTAKWLRDFSILMSGKVFLLAEAAPGKHFYLGDNPVVLHNDRHFGPFGNIGIGVPGIEIYMPLSADLLLCAWCPSILDGIHKRFEEGMELARKLAMGLVVQGKLKLTDMKAFLDRASREDGSQELFKTIKAGAPISSDAENMMFYNGLQCSFAERHVIDRTGSFEFAKRVAQERKTGTGGPRIRRD